MKSFFKPSSIAVVGASPRKIGHQIIKNLLYGYKCPIYTVNPNYSEIEGLPCFPTIEEIPFSVDLAIILVPAPATPSVLEGCARKGIQRVMIQSAGFAEVGDEGKAIQDHCKAIAKKAGIRIWGPNCMGMVDVPREQFLSFMSPSIYEDGLVPGRISLVVQSGMLSGVFLTEMSRQNIGIGKVCSIGNKSDVDECDLLAYLLEDTDTDAVAFYLESMPRGRLFADIARRGDKPIVVLKGGRSEAGARAAMSHTSSLSGDSRLIDSVLQMSGVTLANDFNQMIDLTGTLAASPGVPVNCRAAILTFSGGAGILTCDLLAQQNLRVSDISDKSKEALGKIFPAWMPVANPVDLYPAVELHGRLDVYSGAIEIAMDDDQVDVVIVHYPVGLEKEAIDLEALKKKADQSGKTLLFWIVGRQDAVRRFRQKAQILGIQVYGEISRAVDCLAAASRFQRGTEVGSGDAGKISLPQGDLKPLVSQDAANRVWDEYDSKRLLSEWNIPVTEEKIVSSQAEATTFAQKFGFPVVLKGLLPGEIHKTEWGLIRLDIRAQAELDLAYEEIEKKLGGRGRILLQQQVDIDYELIAGFLRDDQFGPCVMFGLGGIFSELQADVVFALAPLNRSTALELVGRIRGHKLLDGFRGMSPLNKELMAETLVNLGNFGTTYPQIEQIDINPVAVVGGSPVAVDATVILKPS